VKQARPLFLPPDLSRMTLQDRCRYFAAQIADYESSIDGSALLELSDIRRTLEEAAEQVK
jgi:hypothetical protein